MLVVSDVLTTIEPSGLTATPSGSTPTGYSLTTLRVAMQHDVDRGLLRTENLEATNAMEIVGRPPGGLSGRTGAGRYRRPRDESMMRETRVRRGFSRCT